MNSGLSRLGIALLATVHRPTPLYRLLYNGVGR